VTSLAEKVSVLHGALDAASLPHAFGGALALAWCTRQPRGTSDIDLNVFVPASSTPLVLDALPPEVRGSRRQARELERHGQSRLHWDTTPVDLFLNTTPFHQAAMDRTSLEPFAGEMIPFLACSDLAVFKAFFDRRRDWADIEDMLVAHALDVDQVAALLAEYLGPDDQRIAKLREIQREVG
jgi:hypothetical protein